MVRGSTQTDRILVLAALEIVNSNSDGLTPDELTLLEDRRAKVARIVFQEVVIAADRVIKQER